MSVGKMSRCPKDELDLQLTSRSQEDLDGRVLEQVPPGEDGPDLREVPLPMEVVTVAQHLKVKK